MRQSHRGTTACVLGALARIVRSQTLIEIVGDATIQGIVGATDEIADPIHLPRSLHAAANINTSNPNTAALPQRTYGVLPV